MKEEWIICSIGKGYPNVPALVKGETKRYTESPENPEEELLQFLKTTGKDYSVLILPVCSETVIKSAKKNLPELKAIIITDTNKSRLALWERSLTSKIDDVSLKTLSLPDITTEGYTVLKEQLAEFTEDLFAGRVLLYIPARFKRLDKKWCEFLNNTVIEIQKEFCSAAAFRTTRYWHLTLNEFINAHQAHSYTTFSLNTDKKTFPVVITGAGPSLDRNIQTLKTFKNKVCIIATDASVNTLLENNLIPDLIVTMEDSSVSWLFFHRHLDILRKIPLVLPLSANHVAGLHYPGKKIFVKDKKRVCKLWNYLANNIPDTVSLGNCVGHFAFHIAEMLNPTQIILVGFNLALEKGLYHTKAMEFQYYKENPEEFRLIEVEGIDGKPVQTEQSLYFALRYFDDCIPKAKCPVFNSTDAGAKIKGAIVKSAEDILSDKPDISDIMENLILKPIVKVNTIDDYMQRLTFLEKEINETVSKLQEIKSKVALRTTLTSNPFSQFDMTNYIFELLLQTGNTLLQTKFVRLLSSLNINNSSEFRETAIALIEDFISSADFITSLLQTLRYSFPTNQMPDNNKKAHYSFLFIGDEKLVNDIFGTADDMTRTDSEENLSTYKFNSNPNFPLYLYIMPGNTELSKIWECIVKHNVKCIIGINGNIIPDMWSVPCIKCIDIKTVFEPVYYEKSLWIPGYTLISSALSVLHNWKKYITHSVPCIYLPVIRMTVLYELVSV